MQENSLEALLALLGAGSKDAGAAYRELHLRLVRLFRLQSDSDPEALADEAMDRLGKIAVRTNTAGARQIDSPVALALGIARHLLQEDQRRQMRETATARDWVGSRVQESKAEAEILEAISTCLATMPAGKRDLLTTYYEWRGERKIEHHRNLAEKLGLTLNALRNRLMRARQELDACVRNRLRDESGKTYTRPGGYKK